MIDLALQEWSTVGPVQLEPNDLQSLEDGCAALNMRERLRVVPGFHGVEVSSTSYVGRVTLGPFRISVNPKLKGAPLARLVKYAYSLDELSLFDERTDINIEKDGLQDLLVSLLVGHIEAIWLSGLPQTYRHQADDLSSIRGRVRTEVLWRKGAMTSATVPCLFFERTANWQLNRVLRSGIDLALKLAGNVALRTRVAKVQTWFQTIDPLRTLGPADVEEARRSLTRLTNQVAPALELIALLVDGAGVGFRSSTDTSALAFMFDMNRFFQRLISRFLHDPFDGGVRTHLVRCAQKERKRPANTS
jgi:5-methylcytosine-specific restriction enzyme subunit McrC